MSNWQALLISLMLFGVLLSHQPGPQPARPVTGPAIGSVEQETAPAPPAPPLRENFEGEPQLSLFPRLGSYSPESSSDKYPFWRSYILHLQKTSGVLRNQQTGNRAFAFRSIRGLDSVGFFAPLAVQPRTRYRVSLRLQTELPPGGSAGLGVIEYDQFFWLAEQYSQAFDAAHRTDNHAGIRVNGHSDWQEHSFSFTTGPDTRMIHLVLFREGAENRLPVLVDEIEIEALR